MIITAVVPEGGAGFGDGVEVVISGPVWIRPRSDVSKLSLFPSTMETPPGMLRAVATSDDTLLLVEVTV